jgi:hypothetical protein
MQYLRLIPIDPIRTGNPDWLSQPGFDATLQMIEARPSAEGVK